MTVMIENVTPDEGSYVKALEAEVASLKAQLAAAKDVHSFSEAVQKALLGESKEDRA